MKALCNDSRALYRRDGRPIKGFTKRTPRVLTRAGKRVFMSALYLDRLVFQIAQGPQTAQQIAEAVHMSKTTVTPILGALREGVPPYQRLRVKEWLRPEGPHGLRRAVYVFGPGADNTNRRTTPAEHKRRQRAKLAGLYAARRRGAAGPFDGLMK